MNPETVLPIGDVELCVQTAGDPGDPAILLIHGAAASMVGWEEELCDRLAAGRRYVIRYDQRDTGRSTVSPGGHPTYDLRDLARDALGIVDALSLDTVHVVGRSMSGGTALILAVDHPDRVETVTFLSTTTGDDGLPGPTPAFLAAADAPAPALDDHAAWVEHTVAVIRAYDGGSTLFDEVHVRRLVEIDLARATDPSAANHHFAIATPGPVRGGFGDIAVPALVVHGELDPVFPLPHAHALRDAIPGARLVVLEGAGHELPPARWDEFTAALLEHTAPRGPR
ncbi:alpha/beta hydrolase [uncultured Cellulomonas sp.]|uniref:alpha/beta fold hydrolase n=1 Tax=uncultured Cellulomonas sp. TaxID=189682 RepID=UPI0028E8E6D1|nr:alpha/beta hydrolase [uncultured Cellulomonas sp.]